MSYKIAIVKKAFKELAALPIKINVQIVKAIDDLKEEPRPPGCKKLKGESEISGASGLVTTGFYIS